MDGEIEFNVRKHLQIKIKPLPKNLYKYLQKLKFKILDNRELLENNLKERNLPNNINVIEKELQKLSSENGILNINLKLTILDLFLIYGSSQYQYLKQIRFNNLDYEFDPRKYKQAIKNFQYLFLSLIHI